MPGGRAKVRAMRIFHWLLPPIGFVVAAALAVACHDADLETGMSCDHSDQCFSDVDRDAIIGTIECLDRVSGGYCTHTCEADAECCAADGECESGYPQVCSPFENSTVKRCFLSCEPEDVGSYDENEYCRAFAHEAFSCRSSGGGTLNRKVCVP